MQVVSAPMALKNVKRFDLGELQKPEHLPNGWVRVDAHIGKVGVQVYRNSDGSERREFRPAEEVFHADSLDTFALVPLCIDHPPVGLLDASNTRDYQRGTVERPTMEGLKLRARILVTDSDAIEALAKGANQVSCGYTCDLEMTPGEYEGQRYDARQVNVRGNHIALVKVARGGPELRVRLDADTAVDAGFQQESRKMKIVLDGVEFEVGDSAGQAMAKALKTASDVVAGSKTDLEKAQAKLDSANAEVSKLQADLKEMPAKLLTQAQARASLEVQARKILGEGFELKGKTDAELRRAVVEKAQPKLKLDGKSDVYVEAAFDQVVERADSADPVPAKETDLPGARSDAAPSDPSEAEKKFIAHVAKMSRGGK